MGGFPPWGLGRVELLGELMPVSSPRTAWILSLYPVSSTAGKGGGLSSFLPFAQHAGKFRAEEWARLLWPSLAFFQTSVSWGVWDLPSAAWMSGRSIRPGVLLSRLHGGTRTWLLLCPVLGEHTEAVSASVSPPVPHPGVSPGVPSQRTDPYHPISKSQCPRFSGRRAESPRAVSRSPRCACLAPGSRPSLLTISGPRGLAGTGGWGGGALSPAGALRGS